MVIMPESIKCSKCGEVIKIGDVVIPLGIPIYKHLACQQFGSGYYTATMLEDGLVWDEKGGVV